MFRKLTNLVFRKLLGIPDKQIFPPLIKISTPLENFPNVPDLFHQYRRFLDHPELTRKPGGWEYQGRFYQDYLTVGGAGHAIFRVALRFCQGSGIDVGAGLWPLPGAAPLDIWRGSGAGHVLEDISEHSLDFVFSSHCLEHIEKWEFELDRWIARLKKAGFIFLYLPHPECGIWNPGSPMVGEGHKWQPEPEVIKNALEKRHCKIVDYDDGPDAMMSFFVCAQKL